MGTEAMVLREGTQVDWAGLEHLLHERFGVNAVTLQKNGARRTQGEVLLANEICRLIKQNLKAQEKICESLKQRLLNEAGVRKRYATDECDAGMYRVVVPILMVGDIEGFVSVCGRPFLSADRIYTDYISRTTEADESRIQSLLPNLHPITPRDLKEIRHLIGGFAH